LAERDAGSLGRLWRIAGVEVCRCADAIWLRGAGPDEATDRRLRSVAGARRFAVLDDGQLLPTAARVPRGHLPEGPWIALRQWAEIDVPTAAMAGRAEARVPLRLVRSAAEREADVLLTPFDRFYDYAVAAPQVRLDRWSFAVAGATGAHDSGSRSRQTLDRNVNDGEGAAKVWRLRLRHCAVVIRGTPLPPLAGARFVDRGGVAVPAGWTWSPAVDAPTLRRLLQLEKGDLTLWTLDGPWQRIAADDFARAGRSAIRATAEGLADG